MPYTERGAYEFFANTRPTAAMTVDVPFVGAPLLVTANAGGSLDNDGKIVSYQFDFGDGTIVGPQASPVASHLYDLGSYTLTVTVSDNRMGEDTTAAPIVVVPNLATNPGFESSTTGWPAKAGSARRIACSQKSSRCRTANAEALTLL